MLVGDLVYNNDFDCNCNYVYNNRQSGDCHWSHTIKHIIKVKPRIFGVFAFKKINIITIIQIFIFKLYEGD